MANVRLAGLVKKFGDVTAVKDLHLTVEDGEFLILLGPSGCGKTTALRCIAGLEEPESGEIYIGNNLVNNLPAKDRDIAMVFQTYALYPHMTVYDNMGFPLKMRKRPKSDIDAQVKKTAELLRIGHLLRRKPKQLSGGEAQRVALGRAIVRSPKAFLMDEPLSNLDAKLRLYMRAELKRLQKELGTTTIYVTHDQAEAMTMGDRIAVMNHGELQQLSSPDEMYNMPVNLFVAGFLGSPPMNFVDCKFYAQSGQILGCEFHLPRRILDIIKKECASDKALVLGFRPEDVSIHAKEVPGSTKAEVYLCEPLGSETIVDLKVGETILKGKAPPDESFKIGESRWIALTENKIHVFDKETGRRLV